MMDAPVPCRLIRQLLSEMPEEWLGTTFRNTYLLGREGFSANLKALLAAKARDAESTITKAELMALGEAEDYLRVATNVSTTLEALLAFERGLDPARVFSFASGTMPIIAVCLTSGSLETVHLLHGSVAPVLSASQLKQLALLGGRLSCHAGPPPPQRPDGIVLCIEAATLAPAWAVDGVIGESLLYISEGSRIDPAQILLIRKRLATPATTPTTLDFTMTAEGSVADFDEAKKSSLRGLIATAAGVDASAVSLTITAGSVLITVTIVTTTPGVVLGTLSTAFGTPAAATALFASIGVAVTSIGGGGAPSPLPTPSCPFGCVPDQQQPAGRRLLFGAYPAFSDCPTGCTPGYN